MIQLVKLLYIKGLLIHKREVLPTSQLQHNLLAYIKILAWLYLG